MLSLVICSRKAVDLAAVSENVKKTIGVPYELLAIDNSTGKYGICEAYNLGASQAQYPLLCFMHEDIRFRTEGWGSVVVDTLADQTIGAIGVVGGMFQLAAPAAWWGCGPELYRENVMNVFADGSSRMDLCNPEAAALTDVAVVDGLWMCSRREVWEQHPFDSATFTDFHFYDIDYCTELFRQGMRVCVTFGLVLEHHSRGSVNSAWLLNALKYQKKRRGQLPFGVAQPTPSQRAAMELKALQEFTGRLIRARFPSSLILQYLARCLCHNPFDRDSLWLAKLWLRGGARKKDNTES
ncbi:glycosyltransferase [Hymenobacter sp. BT770]|uniref:glycosyltransferase n=1 Tax=Hymenobacter sp. BT770 TaxID=2886942 RepID=UPI001D0F889A|nr:glycosyltransferase [Hymenobacter sp. BT770]MCC3153806.1 glycosyltransferase [Hymenobacter sp. BT770]MDO3415950.1 glycosyltransferase [Hymenobacter sp. BT770]